MAGTSVSQAELQSAVDALFEAIPVQFNQSGNNLAPKAYEVYVCALCLRAARELGGNPVLKGLRQTTANPFIFRGSPGKIYAAGSASSQNYGYATFYLNDQELEIHAGIEFQGSSGMLHEMDVCIIQAAQANKCRAKLKNPTGSCLVVGFECKFYDRQLDKGLGRAFVGLVADMSPKPHLSGLCSNSEKDELRKYLQPSARPRPYFHLTPLPEHSSQVTTFVEQVKGELKRLAQM